MTDVVESVDFFKNNADKQIGWKELRDNFESRLPKGATILDIGAGKGEDSDFFRTKGHRVISIDIKEREALKRQQESVLMKLEDLGFKPESVNAVWIGNVLIFIDDNIKIRILKDVAKIMRRGGYLFICDHFFPSSNFDEEMIRKHGNDWHVSETLHNMIKNVGFEIIDEQVAVDIPEKRNWGDDSGFHVLTAVKN